MGCKCQITYPRAGCSQHDLHHAIAVVIERRLGQRSGKHVGRTRLIGLTTFHLVKIREISYNCYNCWLFRHKKSQPKELEKFTNKMRDLDALSLSQQPITTLHDILMPPQRSAQLSYPTRTYLCAEMWLLAPPRGLCRAGDRVEVLPPKLRRFGFGNLFF